jgi:hypothetical protein
MKGSTIFLIVTILVAGVAIEALRINTAESSNPLISANENSDALTPIVRKIEKIGHVYDVIQTPQGYVSVSKPDAGTWVIRKTSTSGQRIWEKKLSFFFASPIGLAQTSEGYVLVGWYKGGYYYDHLGLGLIALKNDGTLNWTKNFETELDPRSIIFRSVKSKADGGFIIQGYRLLVNFTSRGDILWSKRFKNLIIEDSQPVSDGTILLSNDNGILKVNNSGNVVWKKTLEIKGAHFFFPGSASDNGFVLAGTLGSSSLLVGLDANGNVKWKESYSNFLINFNPAHTPDGGYALLGKTSGGRKSLLKINAKRDIVFQTIFDFSGTLGSVFAANNDGYVIYGSAPHFKQLHDVLFLRLNSKGIVPGCDFFHEQNVNRVATPTFTSEKLDIKSGPFTLPAPGTFQIDLVDSESTTSNACP